jgi:hypothetical protein
MTTHDELKSEIAPIFSRTVATANVDTHIFASNGDLRNTPAQIAGDPRLKSHNTSACDYTEDFVPRGFVDRIIQKRFKLKYVSF